MVNTAPLIEPEPTPEFDQACISVIRRWEGGELPFKEAVAILTQYEQEASASTHIANQARAQHMLGYVQHYRGNLDASIRHYDRARELYVQAKNPRRVGTMDLNNGENYRLKGNFTRARRLYRVAYESALALNDVRLQSMAAANEGLAELAMGQLVSAHKLLTEGYQLTLKWTDNLHQRPGLQCEIHHGLASIYLTENKLQQAWEQAKKANETALESGELLHKGFAYRILGEVVTALGEVKDEGYHADADEYFRMAIDAFREMHTEAETARTVFAHAQSLAKRGRRTMAARKLQQAMIMFTDLGMVDDVAKAAEAQLSVI